MSPRQQIPIVEWRDYPHAYVTLEYLARRWGMSKTFVWKLTLAGTLQTVRFGNSVRVSKQAAIEYEDRCRIVSSVG